MQRDERKMLRALVGFAVFTLALMFTPGAKLLIVLFPAIALGVALYFCTRSMQLYLSLVVWLFLLTPFVRRVVEWRSGSSAVTFIMTAPLVAAFVGITVYRDDWGVLFRRAPKSWVYVSAALGYGLIVGTLYHGVRNALPDLLGWFAPVFFASYLFRHRDRVPEMVTIFRTNFLYGMLVTGLYGLYQFFFMTPWDAYWMETSNLTSIGLPEPMQVRVFSTLNAPQPFADFLIFGLLLCITSTKRLRLFVVPMSILLLGLTMSRGAWVAGFLAFCYVALSLTVRQRFQILAVLVSCVVLVGMATLVPEVNDILTHRLESMNNLKDDGSVNDRLQSQREAIQLFLSSPFGLGFGLDSGLHNTGPSHGVAKMNDLAIGDNGIEEVALTMGWFATVVYLIGFGGAVLIAFRSKIPELTIPRAMIFAMIIQIPVLGIFPGPTGFLLWTALGLCYASVSAREEAGRISVSAQLPWGRQPVPEME